jgi:hypothetical protein
MKFQDNLPGWQHVIIFWSATIMMIAVMWGITVLIVWGTWLVIT